MQMNNYMYKSVADQMRLNIIAHTISQNPHHITKKKNHSRSNYFLVIQNSSARLQSK